ncbi:hypothetical protein MKW92_035429 [Papaver armeniacum]|nr:hypothetical protein MKW92_035429 [Papaver armeniacum]
MSFNFDSIQQAWSCCIQTGKWLWSFEGCLWIQTLLGFKGEFGGVKVGASVEYQPQFKV